MERIPEELQSFMEKPGTILLVRGNPGTGKTTFVLTLMRLKNFAYISGRKSVDDIGRTHPWITGDMEDRMFIIDKKYDYRETDRFGATFYLMPEAIRHVLNLYEDGKISGIIIDSWHTIVEELQIKSMEEKERREIYDSSTFFLKIVKLADHGINFIISKEGEKDDEIAYLSDGVITLHRKFEEGRVYRWLTVDKMRGVEIKRGTYFFTLKDAKFEYMISEPFRHPSISKIGEFPVVDITPTSEISSIYFDDVFKFKRGSVALYDFGEYIPKEYKLTSLMGVMANFLKQGSRVIVIPPNELDVAELKYQILLFGLERYFRNITFLYTQEDFESYIKVVDIHQIDNLIKVIAQEIESHKGGTPPLIVVGYDRLSTYISKDDIMKLLYALKDIVRKRGGVMIVAGNFWDKEIKRLCSNISEIYVKFINSAGDVLMYAIKPWSNVYHLSIIMDGNPKIIKRVIV